jgi:DUF4097 and DUF4098 domain-containing protein YvlB
MRFARTLAVAAALASAGQAIAAETVTRTAAADPRGDVEIVNVSGEVTVSGWDRSEVEVSADLGRGVQRLDVESDKRRVSINVVLRNGRSSSGSADLVVRVPRNSRVTVRTVSADLAVSDVQGAQNLQAVSGSITSEVWGEDFEARSVSGEILARGRGGTGRARVSTVSGNVELMELGNDLELTTVTGDMDVKVAEILRARFKTTNGDLDLRGKLARGARVEAEAINGDLRMHFGQPVDAEFDIETFNGEIDSCFGQRSRRTSEFAPGNELRFREGGGSARVRIKTLNGGVEICGT